MPTTPYTVRLDKEVREALEAEAKLQDRQAAQLAARAIKTMLKANAIKRTAIDEALLQADVGEFISSAAMSGWIDSWVSKQELPEPTTDIQND